MFFKFGTYSGALRLIFPDAKLTYSNSTMERINRLKYAQVKENDTAKYVSWMTNDVSIVDAQGFENIFDSLQTLTAVLVNAT
ncbi:hypothetical protein ACFQHW_07050 [Lapidilactobacillus achengensis]|uniref:Uncharacterized protein n=1 Tax=Lapidilactobacillus achengensis TaxID=2486000 RepID=A0ABW1URB7_9LACO|nr:hypothetical protein [Lapidilactobacillus achengensis]